MKNKVFVGNFSFAVTEEALKEYFSKAGTVTNAKIMTVGPGGRSRGYGFVEFSSESDARAAIDQLNNGMWDGRSIKVSEDRSSGGGSNGPRQSSSSYADGDDVESEESASAPMGYFRAQPFDIGLKRKMRPDPFEDSEDTKIDYKNPKLLAKFTSERGRILPRKMTGLTTINQRHVVRAIKRAQQLAMLPVVE
jgi:cold-inducible RNA-binding protein